MNKLIDLLTGLLPANYKTYSAAAVAALLAANAALAAAGIVFLPATFVTVLTYLATALGLVGVRHAIQKMQDNSDGHDPFLPVGKKFGLLIALGLTAGLMSMGCAGHQPAAAKPKLGCKCVKECPCGASTMVEDMRCRCKAGAKCSVDCECEAKPALRPFKLSALPEGPPEAYEVKNDGKRNGWWSSPHQVYTHKWDWWHDGKVIGTYDPAMGRWTTKACNDSIAPPWLTTAPTGVNQPKLTKEGERYLQSGSWRKGPLPADTWHWGAVVPVGSGMHGIGFCFADFHGDHATLTDGRVLQPDEVEWFNNSIVLPRRD